MSVSRRVRYERFHSTCSVSSKSNINLLYILEHDKHMGNVYGSTMIIVACYLRIVPTHELSTVMKFMDEAQCTNDYVILTHAIITS